jgi:hypothetical protein
MVMAPKRVGPYGTEVPPFHGCASIVAPHLKNAQGRESAVHGCGMRLLRLPYQEPAQCAFPAKPSRLVVHGDGVNYYCVVHCVGIVQYNAH